MGQYNTFIYLTYCFWLCYDIIWATQSRCLHVLYKEKYNLRLHSLWLCHQQNHPLPHTHSHTHKCIHTQACGWRIGWHKGPYPACFFDTMPLLLQWNHSKGERGMWGGVVVGCKPKNDLASQHRATCTHCSILIQCVSSTKSPRAMLKESIGSWRCVSSKLHGFSPRFATLDTFVWCLEDMLSITCSVLHRCEHLYSHTNISRE